MAKPIETRIYNWIKNCKSFITYWLQVINLATKSVSLLHTTTPSLKVNANKNIFHFIMLTFAFFSKEASKYANR